MANPGPSVDEFKLPAMELLSDDSQTSSVVTLEPYVPDKSRNTPGSNSGKLYNVEKNFENSKFILHLKPVPLSWSFDVIYGEFSKFGIIKEIRNRIEEKFQFFETWIIFVKAEDAYRAFNEFSHEAVSVNCTLVEDFPLYLDIFRPPNQAESLEEYPETTRSPEPPSWIILTTRNLHGNLFKVKKFVNQKLGHLKRPDVTRFGRNSFLVHTKSSGQSAMLLNTKLDPEGLIKDIKPHFNFSYARGVVFNEDIYELPDEEILDMCPDVVWKIFKVPRSSMIIFTFINSSLPSELIFENEMVRVRPYRPRVLQCFSCYGFGHASRVCVKDKICVNCSQPEHGECSRPKVCVNCKGEHCARDKECKVYKKEQEALLKSIVEHTSVGHAKKLLSKSTYSDVVKVSKSSDIRPANKTIPATHAGTSQFTLSSEVSITGTSLASTAEASRTSSVGANKTPSDGASHSSTCGVNLSSAVVTPQASFAGVAKSPSSEIPQGSSGAPQNSIVLAAQPDSQSPIDSGGRSSSQNNLDEISLPGSLPDIENSPDLSVSLPIVTVHRSDDDKEMEALSVCQKRSHNPSPPQSSSSASRQKKSDKNERNNPTEDQSTKKIPKLDRFGRPRKPRSQTARTSVSLPSNHKSEDSSKKVPKPK